MLAIFSSGKSLQAHHAKAMDLAADLMRVAICESLRQRVERIKAAEPQRASVIEHDFKRVRQALSEEPGATLLSALERGMSRGHPERNHFGTGDPFIHRGLRSELRRVHELFVGAPLIEPPAPLPSPAANGADSEPIPARPKMR